MIKENTIWHIDESEIDNFRNLIKNIRDDMHKPRDEAYVNKILKNHRTLNVFDNIAVIPIRGGLVDREENYVAFYGLQSYQNLENLTNQALSNKKVTGIVFDIDSGGGMAQGMIEASRMIKEASRAKPTVSFVRGWMASAAYGVGSAANKIIATEGSDVGSIGTVLMHADYSAHLEDHGIKITFIKRPEHKIEGNAYEPLSDDAKEYLQSQIDEHYEKFVGQVAVNRNTTVENIKKTYGGGRMLTAQNALNAGMIDGIGSMQTAFDTMRQPQPMLRRSQSNINKLKIKRAVAQKICR